MGAHRVGQRAEMLTPLMLAASAVCGAQNTAAGYASPLVGSQTTGQMQFIVHKPPLFRLGSGAVLGDGDLPEEPAAEAHLGDLRPAFGSDGSLADAAAGTDSGFPSRPNLGDGSSENRQVEATATLTLPAPLEQNSPRFFVISVLLLAVLSVLGCMMAPGAGPRMRTSASTGLENFNFRIPPGWSPEQESSYSFRAYMTDIAMWIMLTDLRPYQQCAAIIMRLGGAAREMARMVTPQEMTTGGVVNGVAVDPVTYLLGSLHARFADLEEESRLASMTEMLAFTRLPGESINALLARYETVRQRAAIEGQFVMSIEGCSLQILRACNIQSQHLLTLLQPFGGRLPQNDQQLRDMCTQLRRFGHISEGAPGNIASALQGSFQQARPGAYLALHDQNQDVPQQVTRRTQPTFFGDTAAGSTPGGFWGNLLPAFPAGGAGAAAVPQTLFGTPGHGYQPLSEQAYTTNAETGNDDDDDDGTDTDTSSDDWTEDIQLPEIAHMPEQEAAEHIYWMYRRAKRTWRRFTGKPVRRFRRAIKLQKRRRGKGKGKGKVHGIIWTSDDTLAYLKGKGKGHRVNTSGKGHGRRKNPKDRQGNIMRCRICNSDEHFAARCPRKGSGKGHGSSASGSGSAPFAGLALYVRESTPVDNDDTHALDMPQQFFAVFPEPDPFPQEPDTLYEQDPWRAANQGDRS